MTFPTRTRLALIPLFSVALALSAATAHATVYVVTANEDMTFTPADITLHQGDAIRFENAGGIHNVHADDNRFICSLNCTTSNAPSDLPWSVVVRFDRLGTIGYFCDQHGNTTSGMRGSVTVIDRVFVDGFEGP
ncbi:MAG: plastocyanin/azurin family copper-binding protein [Rhodanobacteraceae bacterium]